MKLNKLIEHTNLKPNCTKEDIAKLCKESLDLDLLGVCVAPYFVKQAKNTLLHSPVKVVSVVGFPFGYSAVSAKVEETKKAIIDGADEIDMVMNISAFKSDDIKTVKNDIQSVVTACHLQNKKAKVIIETAFLTDEEIIKICDIAAECRVDFVKTSTGYATLGAEAEKVNLMRKYLPKGIKIKAAGGIKNKSQALVLISAGADIIGSSNSIKLL
jgi:deoxyribose-phosphate aldolase